MTDKEFKKIPLEFYMMFSGVFLILVSGHLLSFYSSMDMNYYFNPLMVAFNVCVMVSGLILAFYGFFKILLKMGRGEYKT